MALAIVADNARQPAARENQVPRTEHRETEVLFIQSERFRDVQSGLQGKPDERGTETACVPRSRRRGSSDMTAVSTPWCATASSSSRETGSSTSAKDSKVAPIASSTRRE